MEFLATLNVFLLVLLWKEVWIELFDTYRADAMRESRHGMFMNVLIKLVPIAFAIPDFFAPGTDWQHFTQRLAFCLV